MKHDIIKTMLTSCARYLLSCALAFFCFCSKPKPSGETISNNPARAEETRLTKEKILEASLELLKATRDYRVPLDTRLEADTGRYSLDEIMLLKNSIYAQYGRRFSAPWLQRYFDSRAWYKPGGYKAESLTDLDKKNAELLAAEQRKLERDGERAVEDYDPAGYIEIGGAFAETFFHLYCPNRTYAHLDHHDLSVNRGAWKKTGSSLRVKVTEECSYKCLENEALGCEKSRFKNCQKTDHEAFVAHGFEIAADQFRQFLKAGFHSGNHDLGWHYNLRKHPLTRTPKICDLQYQPKTFEEAVRNFR